MNNTKKYLIITAIILLNTELYAREFLNNVVHLNFGGTYSLPAYGSIIDSEEERIDTLFPENHKSSHYETSYGLTLDIVPMDPVVLGLEEHAVKFGVRGAYRMHWLQQTVKSGEEYNDRMMDYKSWMVGPVIHYAPVIEPSDINDDYTSNGGFTFFALYGQIDGDLNAYPAIRDYGIELDNFSTSISGYKMDFGAGAEIAVCSLNFGMNVYYSYIKVKMDKSVYPDLKKEGVIRELCLEIYMGIPIESFIEPLIPKF